MKYGLSKSRYCSGLQCPKMLWLKKNIPDAFDPNCMNQSVLESGLEVGDLAMGLFGDFVEVPYDKPTQMAEATAVLMEKQTPIIAEASFSYDGLFCSVDILKNLGNKQVELYEVKSSTGVKDIYHHDAAFQYYVLSKLGYTVVSCNIVHINNQYVRHGELDLHQLFTIVDITSHAQQLQKEIGGNIAYIRQYVEQPTEPTDDIGMHCFTPYDCGFWGYCTKHLPTPNVFDIGGLHKDKAIDCYRKGLASFEALDKSDVLSAKQYMQVEHELHPCPPRADIKNIKAFLEKLTYPLPLAIWPL